MFKLKSVFNLSAKAVKFGMLVLLSAASGLVVSAMTSGNVAAGAVAAMAAPWVFCAILDGKSSADKRQPKKQTSRLNRSRPH